MTALLALLSTCVNEFYTRGAQSSDTGRMPTHPQAQWIEFGRMADGIAIQCKVCRASARRLSPAQADAFVRAHAEHTSPAAGFHGMGDAVAAMTKAVGITPCTPCEARRRALNQMFPRLWPR